MKTIAEFRVQFLQYLDETSQVTQTLPEFAQDINQLISLYRQMHTVRLLDAKAVRLQRTGKMGTYPSSLGQEAVSVGAGSAMNSNDVHCPYYRDQGILLQRGVTMTEILQYWGGDERGSLYHGPKEDLPPAVPIATQCLHATGVGYAIKYRQQQRAVLTTIGEGGTSEGDFYEALNVAGAWKLPVVFLVNNNQWAISVPLDCQTHCKTIAQKAIAGGFDGIQVDGNDIIAVRDATQNALEKARNGEGPSLIEAVTYRLADHTTADDAKRYVDPQQLEAAKKREPVKRLHDYLVAKNAWSAEQETQLLNELKADVDKAVNDYLNKQKPKSTEMFDHLYADLPESLLHQYEIVGGEA